MDLPIHDGTDAYFIFSSTLDGHSLYCSKVREAPECNYFYKDPPSVWIWRIWTLSRHPWRTWVATTMVSTAAKNELTRQAYMLWLLGHFDSHWSEWVPTSYAYSPLCIYCYLAESFVIWWAKFSYQFGASSLIWPFSVDFWVSSSAFNTHASANSM